MLQFANNEEKIFTPPGGELLEKTDSLLDRRPAANTLRRYNGPKGPRGPSARVKVSWPERQQDQRPRSRSRWFPTRMLVMARRFEKMIPIPTRSERVIWWVRHFCIASGSSARSWARRIRRGPRSANEHRRRPLSPLRGARLPVWPRPGGSSRSKMTTSAASASSASADARAGWTTIDLHSTPGPTHSRASVPADRPA
jgi:hypothetical protein